MLVSIAVFLLTNCRAVLIILLSLPNQVVTRYIVTYSL